MLRLISILLLTGILGACTTIKSPTVEMISVEKPYPASLTVKCEEYVPFSTSEIESIIITHAENMEKAIGCKNRTNQLIDIIRERNL